MSNPNQDTILASTATTKNLVISNKASGLGKLNAFVNDPGDHDWIRVKLHEGELYQFSVAGEGIGSLDPTLALRNANGTQLLFDDDGGPGSTDSLLTFRATSGGIYYLDVGGYQTSEGGYSLTAREVPAKLGTFSVVAVGASVTGDIQSGQDQDFHAVTLVAGQSYIFDAISGGAVDTTLQLRDANGPLAADNDGGIAGNARIEFTAVDSGTYYLNVGGFQTTQGEYTLAARVDDAANDIATTDAVGMGDVSSGVLNSATDHDFFAVQLKAGKNYIFEAKTAGPTDAILTLRDGAGAFTATNDDAGPDNDARIEFTAASSGTYFLDVSGFNGSTGGYQVSARLDDVPDDVSTTRVLSKQAVTLGRVDSPGDLDVYAVNLVLGEEYNFQVFSGTLDNPDITLYDSAGGFLRYEDNNVDGGDPNIFWTAKYTGLHYLEVAADNFGSDVGTYDVLYI